MTTLNEKSTDLEQSNSAIIGNKNITNIKRKGEIGKFLLDIGKLSEKEKRELAKNPNTPTETLEKLTDDIFYSIRYQVAINPNTSKDILVKLSIDIVEMVRYGVAINPNTPKDILIRLSNDKKENVKIGFLQNPNLLLDDLKRFYKNILNDTSISITNKIKLLKAIISNESEKLKSNEEYEVFIQGVKNAYNLLKLANIGKK